VPSQQVVDWAVRYPADIHTVAIEGAGHFFHGRLNDLRDVLLQNLNY
jgi:alpha/beta superfamily hydrolase